MLLTAAVRKGAKPNNTRCFRKVANAKHFVKASAGFSVPGTCAHSRIPLAMSSRSQQIRISTWRERRCKPVRKNTESGAAAFYCWVVGPPFFHGFNGVVRTLRRRPPAQVERQRKQVYNITLVGPKSVGFLRCYTHMTQKDYLPKSNGKEKAAKWTQNK